MKIQAGKVDGFIQAPPAGLLGALIYGPDSGLVSERAKALASTVVDDPNDPFNTSDISADQFKDDPAILSDALCAISMMGGKRLVRLNQIANTHGKALTDVVNNLPDSTAGGVFLLVTAGDLTVGSVRTLFEKHEQLAALPCYAEDGAALSRIINDSARQHGLQLERNVAELIASRVQGDRMMARSEVNKIALYMGTAGNVVTVDTALAAIGDSSEMQLDTLVDAVFAGNNVATIEQLHKSLSHGTAPVMLLRTFSRHINMLHTIVSTSQHGQSVESAAKSYRPPIFFKRMNVVLAHARKFNSTRGEQALWQLRSLIYQAERDQKSNAARPELLLERALLKIAGICR